MMANFLDSLRGLGVNYKVHNTNLFNQAEFQTFLVKGIKEGKVPILLIRQGLAFHWVAVRAIGEANTQGQVEVEVYMRTYQTRNVLSIGFLSMSFTDKLSYR